MKKIRRIFILSLILLVLIFLFWGKSKKLPKEKESIKADNQVKIEENLIGNSSWTITQFGANEGGQMMCYTIEGDKAGLVIVDGGYSYREDQYEFIMNKISEHANLVDAWILTHFDTDHAGVFIRIMNEDNNIEIDKIYVSDFPEDIELLRENGASEHDLALYEEYLKLDLPQKVKVYPKDKFRVIDLKMKILCSYEDWIDQKTSNLLNNGSLVFKLYGNKQSMLFCSDVQSGEISDYLIKTCQKDLKSDYLQVGHHGNNGLGEKFYKAVSPKIAFFPAPDWLINNENNVSWFTVEENRAILEKLGAQIIWHNTSPNEVVLK